MNIKRPAPVLVLSVLFLSLVGARCNANPKEWVLVWQDEFTGAQGELPDPETWRFDVGTDWGNAQLEYDTDRAENVSLDGQGNLAIVAREESYSGQDYTSGRINTYKLFAQREGRFEARIRCPSGQGLWPAFWLLGSNFESVGWPQCGEIDIMEYRGQEPRVVHGSLHGPGYAGGQAITGKHTLPLGQQFDDDFHVFAIDWDEDSVTWSLNGAAYQTFTRRDLPPNASWVFDHPFFIILNVAVGGHFVGPPNDATTFPQTMLVDYVRVYRLE